MNFNQFQNCKPHCDQTWGIEAEIWNSQTGYSLCISAVSRISLAFCAIGLIVEDTLSRVCFFLYLYYWICVVNLYLSMHGFSMCVFLPFQLLFLILTRLAKLVKTHTVGWVADCWLSENLSRIIHRWLKTLPMIILKPKTYMLYTGKSVKTEAGN